MKKISVADIDELLTVVQKRAAKSRGSERDLELLSALYFCGPFRPLPDWLFKALSELLLERQKPVPISVTRWFLVLALREDAKRRKLKLTWVETFKQASKRLAGTDAAGGAEAIKKSYLVVARDYRRSTA